MSHLTHSRRLIALCVAALLSLGLAACGNSESTPSVESTAATTGGETTSSSETTTGGNSSFTVEQGVVKGYVDSAKVEGNSVLLTGWSASKNLTEVADEVVARVGGKTVTQTVPAVERADVAAYYGKPALKHSGFLLHIPISSLECSTPGGGVQVFGVLNGGGGRLALVEGSLGVLSSAC